MLATVERKIERDAGILLVVHNLGIQIIKIFTRIFLTVYFFDVTKNIGIVALFFAVYFFVHTIFFYLIGNQIKCKNRMIPFRLGILFNFIFLLLILLLKENVGSYIIHLAVLYGIAGAFYWLPYNVLSFDLNSYSNRSLYLSYEKAYGDILSVIVPVLAGSIIALKSYQWVLIIVLFFTVLSFLISFKISNSGESSVPVDMKGFLKTLKKCGEIDVFRTYKGEFLRGISYFGVLEIIIPSLIIYLVIPDKFILGVLTAVFSLISILTSILVGKFLKDKYFKSSVVVSGIMLFLITLLLLFNASVPSVIFYSIVFSITIPILTILQSVYSYNVIDKNELVEFRVEHFILREVFLNIARIIGYLFLFLLSIVFGNIKNDINLVRIVIVILSISIILIPFQTKKFKMTA